MHSGEGIALIISMSSAEKPKPERDIFDTIITTIDTYDPGLTQYDKKLIDFQKRLNETGGVHARAYKDTFRSVNESWQYNDMPVELSGRIYVIEVEDDEEEDIILIPPEWGQEQKDQRGTFYYASNADLISSGIVNMGQSRMDDEAVDAEVCCPVEFAYGFRLPEDDEDSVRYAALPGEVTEAIYPFPTIEAIDMRLHQQWPEVMGMVDKLIVQGERNYTRLLKRLSAVAKRIDQECKQSQEFTEWISFYLYERVKFDQLWPYALSLSGEIVCEREATWENLNVKDIVRYGRVSGIAIVTDRERRINETTSALVVIVPNDASEDEDDTYTLIVPTESITLMQSTRKPSIGDLVEPSSIDMIEKYSHDAGTVALSEELIEEKKVNEYELLCNLRKTIEECISEAVALLDVQFHSEEGAREAAVGLCSRINELLTDAGVADYWLLVEGGVVSKPRASSSAESGTLQISIKSNDPLREASIDEETTGQYALMHPSIKEHLDESTGVDYYRAELCMILVESNDTTSMLNVEGISLLPVHVQYRALVMLDSTVSIHIPRLDKIEARHVAMGKLSIYHPYERIRNYLTKLDQALHHESDSGFEELMEPNLIRKIARWVTAHPDDSKYVIDALNELLSKRVVKLVGEVQRGGVSEEYGFAEGIIMDIVMKNPNSEIETPSLAITSSFEPEDEITYVPLTSVKQLLF